MTSTDVPDPGSGPAAGPRERGCSGAGRDDTGPVETDLDDAERHGTRTSVRGPLVAAVAVVCVAALVAWGVRASGATSRSRRTPVTTAPDRISTDRGDARARQIVAAAAETTTNVGSFHVVYRLTERSAPQAPTPCTPPPVQRVTSVNGETVYSQVLTSNDCGTHPDVTVTGEGTINTNPKAMRTTSNVSNLGTVTLIADESDVWEFGGANYGSEGVAAGPGAPFSRFASLVEGALAMQSMASPNGYISITKATIANATPIGTGTVGGVPVTNYGVTIDPAATPSGVSPDEARAIADARAVLAGEGFVHTVQDVSIDAMGYIRHTTSAAMFRDGGTMTSDNTFSQFACAGAVAVPGRSPGSPPGPPDVARPHG